MPTLPHWNLSDLFRGTDDPRIKKLFALETKRADAFVRSYRGNITESTKATRLKTAIQTFESILQQIAKPEIYAVLRFSLDASDPERGAFLQKMKSESLAIYQRLVFFELELLALKDATIKRLMRSEELKSYRHYLGRLLESKPHRLHEGEEKLLNDFSLTGRSAFVRLFDQELSTKAFRIKRGAKTETRSQDHMLELLHSPKRAIRKQGAACFTKGLKEELRRLSYVTNMCALDKMTEDRYRKFESAEASRHIDNEITQEMVDAMSRVVSNSFSLVQDFYRFKKRILGASELFDYDRYAPIATNSATYSFDEARRIILKAYTSFSPEFGKAAEQFFTNGWIDAEPKLGKRGGAYCMFVTPDHHPYVFVNYHGNVNDVMTLAHELGHGVHASFAREQTYFNMHTPLTVAETASVFGEMLVFDDLRRTLPTDAEKFQLIVHKLESIFATVHRQISMYRFEQDLHRAVRTSGEQSPEAISALWRKRQTDMFGSSVTLTPDYDVWWSYISHFIHSPFYVYAYAFGELLTLSLFAHYKRHGSHMAAQYITLLKTGGSKTPKELVKPFGIDLDDPMFWQGGVDVIRELFAEAKQLHKKARAA